MGICSTASIFHLITSKKKANQASKCPQSAKKRTLLFKKKWLRKQSLKRLRLPRRLQQSQQKKKPKNNVFKNRKQQIKTSKIFHATIFSTAKNLIHKRTIQWQNSF